MKKLLSIVCLSSIIFSATAQENKEIAVKTSVSEATVFLKGAQVVRKTAVNFPAGKSTLRFTNLSPYIDAKSVQIKVDGEVMVMSVNHQLNYNDTVKLNDDIAKYAKQIEEMDEQIKVEQVNVSIIAAEMLFLEDNRKIGSADKGLDFNNLKLTAEYYNQQIAALKIREAQTHKKIKTLNEEKASIQRKISGAGTIKPEPTGEVLITAESKTALRASLELSYYVGNASWFPSYDIRAKNITQPVDLVYKANVMQNTKEEWKNVKLKISSADPNAGNVAPQLKTYVLNYYTAPPSYLSNVALSNQVQGNVRDENGEVMIGVSVHVKGTSIGTMTDVNGNFSLTLPSGAENLVFSYLGYKTHTQRLTSGYMNVQMEEESNLLEEVVVVRGYADRDVSKALTGKVAGSSVKEKSIPLPVAQVENTTSMEFEIKTPYTIASENKNMVVEMEHYEIPATYEYLCIPKIKKEVFLLAHITDWEQYSLLEGEANIFFENTFVGKTILDVRYMKDTLDISLGRDRSIIVQREKSKEFTKNKFLGNKTEVTRDWKITVRNNKTLPISMILLDQVPVPTTSEIEVAVDKLSGGEFEKETGTVRWKFILQPAKKQELELIYKVKYPKEKTLTVE